VRVHRERKGKLLTFEMDDELLDLEPLDEGTLRLTLAVRTDGASIRPEEALRGILDGDLAGTALVREELLVEWNGRLVNPLLAAAASHARRRPGLVSA
jgi:hypothetical protein